VKFHLDTEVETQEQQARAKGGDGLENGAAEIRRVESDNAVYNIIYC
jgi:hypothetical protein